MTNFLTNTPKKNILITGIPRGGTTLVSAIVDGLHNFACLSEPLSHVVMKEEAADPIEFAKKIDLEFQKTWKLIKESKPVIDRLDKDGQVVTNYFDGSPVNKDRKNQTILSEKKISKDIDYLAFKHNALYFSALESLIKINSFFIVIVIRNPIDVIHSWSSLDLPISKGILPDGEKFWPELKPNTNFILFERYCVLLEMIYGRFKKFEKDVSILRYEDVIKAPSSIPRLFKQAPSFLDDTPAIKQKNTITDEALIISQKFKEYSSKNLLPNTSYFYPDIF